MSEFTIDDREDDLGQMQTDSPHERGDLRDEGAALQARAEAREEQLAELRTLVDVAYQGHESRIGFEYMPFDERAEYLAHFELDSESHERARECGELLARSDAVKAWDGTTDYREREAILRDAESIARQVCEVDPSYPLLMIKEGMLDYGSTTRIEVKYSAETVRYLDDKAMIESLVHEYRHKWQLQVIDGESEHPEGHSARTALAAADRAYEEDRLIKEKHYANLLELDAEKFAREAYTAYSETARRTY